MKREEEGRKGREAGYALFGDRRLYCKNHHSPLCQGKDKQSGFLISGLIDPFQFIRLRKIVIPHSLCSTHHCNSKG